MAFNHIRHKPLCVNRYTNTCMNTWIRVNIMGGTSKIMLNVSFLFHSRNALTMISDSAIPQSINDPKQEKRRTAKPEKKPKTKRKKHRLTVRRTLVLYVVQCRWLLDSYAWLIGLLCWFDAVHDSDTDHACPNSAKVYPNRHQHEPSHAIARSI